MYMYVTNQTVLTLHRVINISNCIRNKLAKKESPPGLGPMAPPPSVERAAVKKAT